MPSPFSSKKPAEPVAQEGVVQVTNSVLICDMCFEEVHDGLYYPDQRRLTFTCSQGHDNVVRGIEI